MTAAAATSAAVTNQRVQPRDAGAVAGAAAGTGPLMDAAPLRDVPDPDSDPSANATSRAVWNRSAGFFSRQWRMMRSSAGEMSARVPVSSGGSSLRTAVIVSAAVSRWKARWPETIS